MSKVFPEVLKDIFLYGIFTLARTNEDIKRLIVADEFSFTDLEDVLRNFDALSKELSGILGNSDDKIIQDLKKKLEASGVQIARDLATETRIFSIHLEYYATDVHGLSYCG